MNERQRRICTWAHNYLQQSDFCVLDNEATGLNPYQDEVIETAIISGSGEILFSSLIQTQDPNRQALATHVHGISREMLAYAPTFPQVWPTIKDILSRYTRVLVYNADYDRSLLEASARRYGYHLPDGTWSCLMTQYAEYHGDWNEYHQSYTWKRLHVACSRLGVQVDGNYHRATKDALCTLGILHALAAQYQLRQGKEEDR